MAAAEVKVTMVLSCQFDVVDQGHKLIDGLLLS